MTQLVVIPARAGSKGIPGKNSKLLAGKPLIQYTIEAALEVFDSNQICVSTDSLEIKNLAEKLGLEVPFKRPPELASDYASTRDVLLHAMEFYGNRGTQIDQIVLLQPTSPFRTGRHIEDALHLYSEDPDMVASVQKTKSNPYYVLKEENSQGYLEPLKNADFTRRQDCPDVYEFNGAIYLINPKALIKNELSDFVKIKKFLMTSRASIDLDDPIDWIIAETLLDYVGSK